MNEQKKCPDCPYGTPISEILERTDKDDVKLVIKTLCHILTIVGYSVAAGGFFAGLFYGVSILDNYIPVPKLLTFINNWFGLK